MTKTVSNDRVFADEQDVGAAYAVLAFLDPKKDWGDVSYPVIAAIQSIVRSYNYLISPEYDTSNVITDLLEIRKKQA